MTHKELQEQIVEFRKVFSNKNEVKNSLREIAKMKDFLDEDNIISLESIRLDLVFGIDSIKLSYGEIISIISSGNVSDEDRALAQEFIMMADDAIAVSNEIITIIDTIV